MAIFTVWLSCLQTIEHLQTHILVKMSSQWVGWNPTMGVKISPSKPKAVKADAASVMRIPPRKKTPK